MNGLGHNLSILNLEADDEEYFPIQCGLLIQVSIESVKIMQLWALFG